MGIHSFLRNYFGTERDSKSVLFHYFCAGFTEIGGSWSRIQLSIDKRRYDALSKQERECLYTAGEAEIKASITEWHVRTDTEMTLWRAGAIDPWLNAKGSFDPATARRVLEEQGMARVVSYLR